jgi:preprotein translocase subunit Sec61beta
MYDNINDFMDRFEKKEAIKKEKRKIAKEGLIKFYEEENEQRSAVSD